LRDVLGMVFNLIFNLLSHFGHYLFPELGDREEHYCEGVLLRGKTLSELLIIHIRLLDLLEVSHRP
jgi:hypothetical protein